MQSTGNLLLMKEINRGLILDSIRQHSPLSRADLAKETGLHPSTVTRIVASLIEEGIVQEGEAGIARIGRKPIMLSLVPNAAFIIGVVVEATFITGIIANLNAQIVAREHLKLVGTTPNDLVAQVKVVIDRLLATAKLQQISVVGIGLAMHGLVDGKQGIALFPPAFGWRNVPLLQLLAKDYQIPLRMENNGRAMTLGEYWFGRGRGVDNLFAVKVGQGIGSGLLLKGTLFTGESFSAGEIGHTTVAFNGPQCDCGNYGCLESVASIRAIVKQGIIRLKQGIPSMLKELTAGNADSLRFSHILTAADQKDKLALELLEDTGRYLGVAIANGINLLNPSKILLGGDIYPALDHILPTVRQIVRARALSISKERLTIEPVGLGADAVAIGAVTLILKEIFYRQ